jgi:hypothetical protein
MLASMLIPECNVILASAKSFIKKKKKKEEEITDLLWGCSLSYQILCFF